MDPIKKNPYKCSPYVIRNGKKLINIDEIVN